VKHITLEASGTGVTAFDIVDLAEYLSQLTDPRDKRGKVYPLGMVLALIILAKLAGEDKPSAICEWIRLRCDEFVALFNCKHRRMPCLNIIRWILEKVVTLAELEKLLRDYLHKTYGGQQSQLVIMDGKTMRGTIPKGSTQGVHLLTAFLPEEGIVLKQIEVGSKENEVSAAPQLIADLGLKNRVVCGDALHTQRQLSLDILAKGGNYLWFVKNNQPTLRADVEQFFKPPQRSAGWLLPELPRTTAETTNSGHGRIERRRLTMIQDEQEFLDWPGVRQVFKLERQFTHLKSGEVSTQVVYGITSCDAEMASAEQLLAWTRQYWGIENGLHYRRDVTLKEDATRMSQPTLAATMATLNNFVVSLAQKLGYANLASARRIFNARIAAQLT
jgi:predicted transposase YbfD/YdcC